MISLSQTKDYKIDKKSRLFRMKANVVGSKLIQLSGFHHNYIQYYLQIETDYLKWTLKKRYEDFYKINTKLSEIIPELKQYFPPKRLLKSSDSTVSERIKSLNKYLNYLFCNINIFLIDEVLDFISINKEIVELFIKKYSMLNIDEDNSVLISLKKAYDKIKLNEELKPENERTRENNINNISDINNIINTNNSNNINNIGNQSDNYYDAILDYEKKRQLGYDWDEPKNVTPNLFVIKEFLINLSENTENKTTILETFENFLNKGVKWIKLTTKEIMTLYMGDEGMNDLVETTNMLLNKYNNNSKKKEITSDFKYHSFIEFYDMNEDMSFKENDEEYYSLNYDNKIDGLFYIIGNYTNNIILSIGALDFLNKLIDTEYNLDAEIYIKVFQSCDIKDYIILNLNKIIKNNIGGNKNNLKAIKLLKLIFYDKSRDEYKRKIMEDDTVYKQYLNYLNKFIE